jgi:peptidyl-prolyl cis-trans isomerase A (cyclophilin A)
MSRPPGTYAIFETSQGNIVVRLLEKETPKTVENFIGLAEGTKEFTDESTGRKTKKNFYDGLAFHRVIPQFMIQGGCPQGTGRGGPGYNQFFITVAATPWLDNKHTIFGEVLEGQDVANKISNLPRDSNDRPKTPVVLEKVRIERVP